MKSKTLPSNLLITPKTYWIRCYDGPEGVAPERGVGESFETYFVEFRCQSCRSAIQSQPLVPNGKRVKMTELDLKSIDRADFLSRLDRMVSNEQMGVSYSFVQACSACESSYLILFGAVEWQPTRYIIVLGGIYEY